MVNYGRVQFVSIELGISPITLIHNRLHAWKCFLVAPLEENDKLVKTLYFNKIRRFSFLYCMPIWGVAKSYGSTNSPQQTNLPNFFTHQAGSSSKRLFLIHDYLYHPTLSQNR